MPVLANTSASAGPTPRPQAPNGARPRPMSMPMSQQGYISATPAGSATNTGASALASVDSSAAATNGASSRSQKPRSSNRVLGDYTLGKTLGQGSMGKVKLAYHNITGEKLAIKILPRVGTVSAQASANGQPQSAEAAAKQASKDASKEIRTIREAALSMLLHHPYVCGMRELITHTNHYYMVFEYINGGQMLDYIISHGRLRERVARKFSRQIGSALDYCHRNNVVHRDLKIENILISQTGNIKIIDFGLSNLYNPMTHLSTFCGSLYFAAPELLNAKVYTGPEVDVWSFGVVLYVLVCGKVPFDDQSMPALHAKIKRGLVEYPDWLSAECKHLLTRMLVVNPAARATLAEVLSHPWMTRGHGGPPDPHMLHREPLRADELDRQVIKGMQGFEFGTEDEIEQKLVEVLESEAYTRSVQNWERKRQGRNGHGGLSNASLASYDSGVSSGSRGDTPSTPNKKSRRFSGFDFYRRKLFSPGTSPPDSPSHRTPPSSSSHLSHASLTDLQREPPDPTGGFHPLISMYFLAREKLERERVYGPGHFANSQMSLLGRDESHAPNSMRPLPSSANGKQQPQPQQQPQEASRTNAKADYNMALPRLPAPASPHYPQMSYNSPQAQAAPSPSSPVFPQPRARDAGVPMPNVGPNPDVAAASTPPAPAGVPLTPAKPNMPRAPPASEHRRSHSISHRPGPVSVVRGYVGNMLGGHHEPPATARPDLGTFPEKNEREQEKENLARQTTAETAPAGQISPSHQGTGATLVRKFGTILGAGRGDDGRRSKRMSILGGISPRPSAEGGDPEKKDERATDSEKAPIQENERQNVGVVQNQAFPAPSGGIHRRAATLFDPQGRAARHERRSSTGAALFASTGGTLGRHRRPSTSAGPGLPSPGTPRTFPRTEEETQVEDAQGEESATSQDAPKSDDEQDRGSDKEFKLVFLKGLFSVSTTTSKPPSVIKTDIRRVLSRMQVQYRETKTGFECVHAPSIDLSSVQNGQLNNSRRSYQFGLSSHGSDGASVRRSLTRKASKLSFGLKGKDKEKERDREIDSKDKESVKDARSDNMTLGSTATGMSKSTSSSLYDVSSNTHTIKPETGHDDNTADVGQHLNAPVNGNDHSRPNSPTVAKTLPPIPRDFAATGKIGAPSQTTLGPTDQNVFEAFSANALSVRFEINIVKVPWLPLHGLQFRRAGGDGWQYQMLARRVLTELKL